MAENEAAAGNQLGSRELQESVTPKSQTLKKKISVLYFSIKQVVEKLKKY